MFTRAIFTKATATSAAIALSNFSVAKCSGNNTFIIIYINYHHHIILISFNYYY